LFEHLTFSCESSVSAKQSLIAFDFHVEKNELKIQRLGRRRDFAGIKHKN